MPSSRFDTTPVLTTQLTLKQTPNPLFSQQVAQGASDGDAFLQQGDSDAFLQESDADAFLQQGDADAFLQADDDAFLLVQ